jgi:hypothetical protein
MVLLSHAGCLDTSALALKIHIFYLLLRPRGDARLARAAVRLLCTQEPAPREDDSWARAPVLEIGLLVLAEVKRRTTAGCGLLLRGDLPSSHSETDAQGV